jgi:hypothetical protein
MSEFALHTLPCGCVAHQPGSGCSKINPLRIPMRGVSDEALEELIRHALHTPWGYDPHVHQLYAALIELKAHRRKQPSTRRPRRQ